MLCPSVRRLLILRTVSTTIRCCACRPVRKKIVRFSFDEKEASSAADRAAAVFPIPVGAQARWLPLLISTSYASPINSSWPGRNSSWAR